MDQFDTPTFLDKLDTASTNAVSNKSAWGRYRRRFPLSPKRNAS